MANPFRNTGISLITALTVGFTAYSGKSAQAQTQIPIEILSEDKPDSAHIRFLRDSAADVISHRAWKYLHNVDITQKGPPVARPHTKEDRNVYRYRHNDKHIARTRTPVQNPGDISISIVAVDDLLKAAKGKTYISYIDTDLKEYVIAVRDMQALNRSHHDTAHTKDASDIRFYLGFSDEMNATYWNPENSCDMGAEAGLSIVTMTTGMLKKVNLTIANDAKHHDESHKNNYTEHDKAQKLPKVQYNVYNQYLEYQCDSTVLAQKAASGTLPERCDDLGLPQLMAISAQASREAYESETRGILSNPGAVAITKEKNARIKEKRETFQKALSLKPDPSADYPSPMQRTYYQFVLFEYFREIRRAGKETDVSRALHMLLPKPPNIAL